ncbi:PREDICTED: uncharacterized protein LOC104611870 [Nelumbo nucifera]|uniref:Uncharacterized protein LOC104611870 n=1 Tax=Nelumbo nucifera TaxID=4432 RepID=A0A1U8B8L0_NELNU|nr:PREDICTED: uncharacterized protein LOC104611870 [Nelumbo nucifera]
MTYNADDDVVPEMKLQMGDENGDYVRLECSNDCEAGGLERTESPSSPIGCRSFWGRSFWWWAKVILACICLGLLTAAFLIWAVPFVLDKVVIPILDWEMTTFSPPVLGVILFVSIALFPTLLLPSSPSMWVAGITFGYGLGFLLIIAGVAVGVSLPYFIGSCFHHKIQRWLEKSPKKAAIIRLAGAGDWFHQFRAVTLLRISPFPYIIFNYAVVATNVKYGPYILGSLVGVVPEVFVTIYSGILIRTLADAAHEKRSLSTQQTILNIAGFCGTIAVTVAITLYAKRQLKKLRKEEVPLLE